MFVTNRDVRRDKWGGYLRRDRALGFILVQ